MIQRIDLRSLDPLRLLAHESVFPDQREKEEEGKEGEEHEDDERLLKIWQSLLFEIEEEENAPAKRKIILRGPVLLKELSRRLNSTYIQDQIKEKIFLAEHGPKGVQAEGSLLLKNLEKLNQKIDRANQVWFRKIPLVSRVFSIIDRIRIPHN
jgi:hypothetical protein